MVKKLVFMMVFMTILNGCQSKFKCGYDPDSYLFTDAFSLDSEEYLYKSLESFIGDIEKYGITNGYCIANRSRFQNEFNRYSANIRLVKENVTFHIYGDDGFILHFAQKENNLGKQQQIQSFCDFLSKQVNVNKITYYEKEGKGKLCDFETN